MPLNDNKQSKTLLPYSSDVFNFNKNITDMPDLINNIDVIILSIIWMS